MAAIRVCTVYVSFQLPVCTFWAANINSQFFSSLLSSRSAACQNRQLKKKQFAVCNPEEIVKRRGEKSIMWFISIFCWFKMFSCTFWKLSGLPFRCSESCTCNRLSSCVFLCVTLIKINLPENQSVWCITAYFVKSTKHEASPRWLSKNVIIFALMCQKITY